MQQVALFVKENMAEYDYCVDFWTVEHLELVSKEMISKDVIALEQNMLKWLQTDLIYKALQWRDFI